MTKPRSTSQIIQAARDCLRVLDEPEIGAGADQKAALRERLLDIVIIATRMDASPRTADPTPKKRTRSKPAASIGDLP